MKNPEGGKTRKIGSARSAEEKNEARRGLYDATVRPQLLRGTGREAALGLGTHMHIVTLWAAVRF